MAVPSAGHRSPAGVARTLVTLVAFVVTGLSGFVGIVSSARPANAASAGAVVVVPGPASSLAPGGAYFLLHQAPGSTVQQAVELRNVSPTAVAASVESVGASSVAGSAAVYARPHQARTGNVAWVAPDQDRIELAPGATATVGFTVAVPRDATPGDHLVGLSVATATAAAASDAGGGLGVSVDTQVQHVIAVEIEVPGATIAPSLAVTGTSVVTTGDASTVVVRVANRGNGIARARATIAVPGAHVDEPFAAGTILPGTNVDYRVALPEPPPRGDEPVDVTVRYGDRMLRWSGPLGGTVAGAGRGGPGGGLVAVVVGAAAAAAAVGLVMVAMGRRRREPPNRRRSGRRRGR